MTTLSVVGKPVPRVEGRDKVSGRAQYAADIALPGMLWGKILRSPHAHARIVRIDASRARALPGVAAVVVGTELPKTYLVGRSMRDMPVLATEKVRFIGDKVAAVAAEDPDIADEALSLIDVEYEELPAVFDPVEAMRPDAPRVHESAKAYQGHLPGIPDIPNVCSYFARSHGELEAAFRESDHVFEHTFQTQRVHQGYIEPHSCVVNAHASGKVEIWASNKNPYIMRGHIAAGLDIPEELIVVYPVSIGGDFGGKGDALLVAEAYLLSRQCGRPVKMLMSYREELMAGNPRHAAVISIRTGVKSDGHLCAMDIRVLWDTGAYGAFIPVKMVMPMGAFEAAGCYRVDAMSIEAYAVYTNQIPGGHFRAPGSASTVFAVESHLDMIAGELGMDPLEFRLRNVLQPGDEGPLGQQWQGIRAQETLKRAGEVAGWGLPKSGSNVGRGLAMYHRGTGFGKSSAKLTLNADGSLTLLTPIADQGTGASTVALQFVAEALQVSPERVQVRMGDTNDLPFDAGTGHSRTTATAGGAALKAAEALREYLLELAGESLEAPQERLIMADNGVEVAGDASRRISLEELAHRAAGSHSGPIEFSTTYEISEAQVTTFCAQVAEVEVDLETGHVKVLGIVTVHDVGTVVNPVGHQGQIEGGVVTGVGGALMEDHPTDAGQPVHLHLGSYKIPNIQDIPRLQTVLLVNPLGPTPYLGRGIGEISNNPTAGAIANAVADAVGVRLLDLPITAEKVHAALRARR